MKGIPYYPLRFEPVYQYRPWGGRRLGRHVGASLPGDGPIGEAWILSDRDEYPSVVADGPLKGKTIRELLGQSPERMLGKLSKRFKRFPVLLKLLDVSEKLSVQVHPSDAQTSLIPPGDTGKDEAWIVLENGPRARIYAGLKPRTSADVLRHALAGGTVPTQLSSFVPSLGDAVYIPARTVHSLSDVVVFEVQENSDVTFRLYDWDRVDPMTGQRRPLQADQAMSCIDFEQTGIRPTTARVQAMPALRRERLVVCDHFGVTRIIAERPFVIGEPETPRVLVCLSGGGELEHAAVNYSFGKGDVLLLSAEVGACAGRPHGSANLLEISLPEAY